MKLQHPLLRRMIMGSARNARHKGTTPIARAASLCLALSFSAAALLSVNVATAKPDTWTGSSGGAFYWSTATNWSAGVPQVGDDLFFFTAGGPPGSTTYTELNGGYQINSITFHPGSSNWVIDVNVNDQLILSGTGISNDGAPPGITTLSGTSSGGHGGLTQFFNSATAANITIDNNGAQVDGALGGFTRFTDTSTAGTAKVKNSGGEFGNAAGGSTQFAGSATAQQAVVTNFGGTKSNAGGGATTFKDSATANQATIFNTAAGANGAGGGVTEFLGGTADHATLTTSGSSISGAGGGRTLFTGSSTAANATFVTNSGTVGGSIGGITTFDATATAANATLTTNGGTINGSGPSFTQFVGGSSAGQANLTNNGGLVGLQVISMGTTQFSDTATAGSAMITNNGGTANGYTGGSTQFAGNATAANATIITNGGTVGGSQGGLTTFTSTETTNPATAGNATIVTNGGAGSGASSGTTQFLGTATAGSATLTTNGSADNNTGGGALNFKGNSTAGNATLISSGPTSSGGRGGSTTFSENADGGNARAVTDAGGFFFIGVLAADGMEVGSIEGAGTYILGKKTLSVGANNRSTTVSGLIVDNTQFGDTGGALRKVGAGSLTLSGANTYTGFTRVDGGTLLVDNSSGSGTGTGPVSVNNGGILGGNGTIAGAVTVNRDGALSPGNSPGKLTINSSYTQTSGATLNIELGGAAPGTGFDQLAVTGSVTLDGILRLSLVNGFRPAVGDTFQIITSSTASGIFAKIDSSGFTVRSDVSDSGVLLTVTAVAPVPVITSATSASATQDQTFTYQITATDSPTSFDASGLPSGLTVDAATGIISGTPTVAGSFAVTISATNSAGPGSATLTLSISPPSTATPSPTPGQAVNISTRMNVLTGFKVMIGGFYITGTDPKTVIIRARGPSLGSEGVQGDLLLDPTLELHQGATVVASNDNWKVRPDGSSQQAEIEASGIPPNDDREAALVVTLDPGPYTAIVAGKDGTTGIGLVEVYDLATQSHSKLANISTRGFVETGSNVIIGGFIIRPLDGASVKLVIRAIGPSLTSQGVEGALQDPTLELRDVNGALLAADDNWQDDPAAAEIQSNGLAPQDGRESASLQVLTPGSYTAIVRGVSDSTGVGLVEVYALN